jgi:hypothetical protein
LNGHDLQTFVRALHFPHVRIDGDGSVEVSMAETEFLGGSEPGRQRTWYETRLDRADIVHVSANGVNVSVVYSRRDRSGEVRSQYEALLAVRRGRFWLASRIWSRARRRGFISARTSAPPAAAFVCRPRMTRSNS